MKRIERAIARGDLKKAQYYSEYRYNRELNFKKNQYPEHIAVPGLVLFSFSYPE